VPVSNSFQSGCIVVEASSTKKEGDRVVMTLKGMGGDNPDDKLS
jgi:hypothetical protein